MPRQASEKNPEVADTRTRPTIDRRRFLGATAGASLAALVPASASVAASEGTVTLVHDTHFHGRFVDAGEDELNIARYYTIVQEILSANENSFFVGNGDDLAPSMLGLEYEGEHMIEALNYMEIDVNGAGNHEFDFGTDVAIERFEESDFPWVVANLLTDEDEPVPGTERWITREAGDLTVGFFGLVSESFHSLTDYREDWQVLGYVEGSQEAVDALREEGADVVVCASHVSNPIHYLLAEEVDGLDAIVGSHSGVVFDEPEIVDGTVISEFGDEFDHVGAITLDADGNLVDWQRTDLLAEGWDPAPAVDEYEEITALEAADVEEDEFLADLTERWTADLEETLGRPHFVSETELNGTFDNYAVETGFGNLITDAMRTIGDVADIEVDVAVQNGGGIRGDVYGPGEITGTAVMETLPFPNEIEVVEVTGEQLVAYLEREIRPHPDGEFGAQPAIQVSGVSYEWRGHYDETAIDNVFVGGEPVDPEETYYLANNDYVVENDPVLSEAETVLESGQFQGPYVLEVLEEWGTVAPERENRMLRVDEDVGDARVSHEGNEVTICADVPEGAEEIRTDAFRAVIRTGDDVEPETVEVDGDTIYATFGTDALARLVAGADEPALRIFGGYDPDQDHWEYDFDVPTSDGYDHFKLKATVDAADVPGGDRSEGGDDGDDASDDEDGESPETASQEESEADSLPGFGPFAAAAAAGGGAYLYSRLNGDDDQPE